jgi:hypothetical protein
MVRDTGYDDSWEPRHIFQYRPTGNSVNGKVSPEFTDSWEPRHIFQYRPTGNGVNGKVSPEFTPEFKLSAPRRYLGRAKKTIILLYAWHKSVFNECPEETDKWNKVHENPKSRLIAIMPSSDLNSEHWPKCY